ncbi:MAG TPA: long-chain fatty acid--CoA ligase, partial [Acidobacteria bacterium]|nr:long-chain fatty acid--CoA ligase [Acidobacteriota bacterium]
EPPRRPAALRLVLTAGALLGAATAARFREAFGLPVHVFYGASECGGICYDRTGDAAERGTVGTPVDGVQ